jgi:HEAT repeat protein
VPDDHELDLLRRAAAIEDVDDEERWAIVQRLQGRTDRGAFDAARALARSNDLHERVLGLDVLGQIGYAADRPFVEETLPLLLDACTDDRTDVLWSAVSALGHLCDPRGRGGILRHAAHPSQDVRRAAAQALPFVAGDPADAEVVAALVGLSADTDSSVRDWATFGLGSQLTVDTPAVRDALAARLADEDRDTAGEALVGLALRKDARSLTYLLAALDDEPGDFVVEGAAALGAPELLPALQRLKAAGWDKDVSPPTPLDAAIAACSV